MPPSKFYFVNKFVTIPKTGWLFNVRWNNIFEFCKFILHNLGDTYLKFELLMDKVIVIAT